MTTNDKRYGAAKRAPLCFETLLHAPGRAKLIKETRGQLMPIDKKTPIGLVQLYLGDVDGMGPPYALITVVNGEKVAVPLFQHSDHRCRHLSHGDRVGCGLWFPFSIFNQDTRFSAGLGLGQLNRSRSGWTLNCLDENGQPIAAPVPRHFDDYGWPFESEDGVPPNVPTKCAARTDGLG